MSRTLSNSVKAAIFAPQTGEVFLHLLTITHADLPAPLRLVDNTEAVVSNGDTYQPFPFQVGLPSDDEDEVRGAQLVLDNTTRDMAEAVRLVSSSPSIDLSIILASDPDTIIAGPWNFEVLEATFRLDAVTLDLGYEPVLNEPFPGDAFVPSNFPGLF